MSLGALYGLLMGNKGAQQLAAGTEALKKEAEDKRRFEVEQASKNELMKRAHPTLQEESQQIESVDQSSPSALSNLLMLKGRENADQIAAEIASRNAQTDLFGANAASKRLENEWYPEETQANIDLKNAQTNKALNPQKDLATISPDKVISLADGAILPQLLQDLRADLKNPKYASKLGPVAGRLTSLNPWDEERQYIDAKFAKVKQLVGKFIEGGVLRAEDTSKYDAILSGVNKNPKGADRVLDALEKDLVNKYNSHVKYLSAAGYDTSKIPLLGQKDNAGANPPRRNPSSSRPQPQVSGGGSPSPSKRSLDPYLSASDDAIQAALAKRGIK